MRASVDLEDSNLFALNRFPGYDRWEDGIARHLWRSTGRSTGPNLSITTTIGQSYRLNRNAEHLPRRHRPDRPLLRHRRPDPGPLRPLHRPHPPLPGRQGQSRGPPQRDRPDRRQRRRPMPRSAICASTATSTRRSRICATRRSCGSPAGSSSPRYWSVFGATVLDLTGQRRGSAVASPTASSRCGTGSASLMRTNALSLACRGGATMSASATSDEGQHLLVPAVA